MGKIKIAFTVNGKEVSLLVGPQQTLLSVLREELKLTGAKKGCEIGECGSCTVILDGIAVNSCMVVAGQVDGREVMTVEGLGDKDTLDPLQESFLDNHVVQCGFCTSGMLMSGKALLMSKDKPTRDEVRKAISGSICRCSDYTNVVKAVEETIKK